MMPMPTRAIPGISFDAYRAIDAISSHGLMLVEQSPAHFRQSQLAPRESSPAQALGTLVHLLTLEPEREAHEVAVAPELDRRTKAGKEAYDAFHVESQGKLIVTADDLARARAIREAVMAQPFARALLADGQAETTLLWRDQETGVDCKARPDWLCAGHQVVLDVKTARDASADAFARAAGSYAYHLQAALYLDALGQCGLGERTFVFLVVETEPPYAVALYQLDEAALHAGRIRYRRALAHYAECLASGLWPGYPTEIQPLSLPKWAL
jgi:hypothetical protein